MLNRISTVTTLYTSQQDRESTCIFPNKTNVIGTMWPPVSTSAEQKSGMVEVQSASSFHKLVHSQVITRNTSKEDTQIRRVGVYAMDKPYSRLLLIYQKGGVHVNMVATSTA